ncbi:hypothetical protein QUA56_08125 [Microcoleus sp. N3A4]|uniref:hypothetical protein n=1 Tax=Microcoleus sp. N3A4 TaxID=3055379 RepID=UPI002FD5CCFE
MTEPSFEKFKEEMAAIGGEELVLLEVSLPTIFSIISTIQLASRHPAALGSSTVHEAIETTRRWQRLIFPAQRFPAAAELLERGWKKEYDGSVEDYAGDQAAQTICQSVAEGDRL